MINYCEICGEENRLFEAVTSEGVKFVCRRCLRTNNFPLITKADLEQIKSETMYYVNKFHEEIKSLDKKNIDPETEKFNKELGSIVSQKLKKGVYSDLVDNFHWHLQQGRRHKKISQKQLADAIAESEILVAGAERGELSDDYDKLISKLEQFLGITIRKSPKKTDNSNIELKKLDFSKFSLNDLKKLSEENRRLAEKQKEEKLSEKKKKEANDIELVSFEENE